jgi:glycosyltransferase involved in cell wall biosynthesis
MARGRLTARWLALLELETRVERRNGSRPKVMFVAHNHPQIRPGGSEGYAFEIYEALRDAGDFEPMFVARSGPPYNITERHHEGRPFTLANRDPNQYLFYTDASGFDWLFGRSPHKSALTRFFSEFLLDHEPDIVHFHHTMFLGYDILRVTRNTLPNVPIVFTLHEYMPICHRDGQMVRTVTEQVCDGASPRRCHECFPDTGQGTFLMRERFIKSQLEVVDLFITPSRDALERYVAWGIPRSRIVHQPHGRPFSAPLPEADTNRPRDRFGFFGQLTAYKGANILLEAMSILGPDWPGRLWIHGANLEIAKPDWQERLRGLLEAAHGNVHVHGEYSRRDLPRLMERVDWVVVPSIWPETGPLTLLEAFQHERPVICSDIGGMAEKVIDGTNGLHFRRGNPHSLAAAMRHATETPGLWDRLRDGIPRVQNMEEHVERLAGHYRGLLHDLDREETPPLRRGVPQHA